MKLPIGLCCLILLSACASPTPPTMTRADLLSAQAALDRIGELPVTPSNLLPSDTATYSGHLGATVTGDVDGSILGDLSLTVAFDSGMVRGQVDNVNLFDEYDRPDQLLSGVLDIRGSEAAGALAMTAEGRLTGVNGLLRGDSDVTILMTGIARTDTAPGDSISGTAYGYGEGDFYVNFSRGGFYATRD